MSTLRWVSLCVAGLMMAFVATTLIIAMMLGVFIRSYMLSLG